MRTRYWLMCVLLLCCFTAKSQQQEHPDTIYKPLISLPKSYLLDNIDLIANMRFAGQNRFVNGTYTGSSFVNEQFRLEIKGKVTDKLYFRFRDRYTRNPETQSVDNISRSTDLAYLRFDPNEHWKIYAGKLCADWGGYEFDANPIDIYEYSDMIEFADNFLSGAGVGYLPNKQHEFTVQLLNSRTKTFHELYDTIPGINEAKFPFAAVANWRGSFWEGKFQTIWSYSIFKEATHQYMNYFAFGNQLQLKGFRLQYDFKLSLENLDRKLIVSGIVHNGPAKQGVRYVTHWVSADVKVSRIVHLAFQGMVDFACWDGNPDPNADKRLRVAWGYVPGVEVYPLKSVNLKVYANMVGRVYRYTDYAKAAFGQTNGDNFRFSVGIVTPLTVL
ncbi:phosphate-selective porin O/P [Chitinophaga dinghuensis]|uniref:Phosphate-selective porin O/P n=1 Tax=Chitinophaga dinghuensis TaxID=1539050 RepID=A0A327W0A3_9BACT|nr:porin [Chitinophaga dinghuensis]RAJ81820.1 phosphate-selective porin O/P [Chitinophaga dinghuensis]